MATLLNEFLKETANALNTEPKPYTNWRKV